MNNANFPLYLIMVEDGEGRGRPVFFAFVRQETTEMLTKMVSIFIEIMGPEAAARVQVTMTDKCRAEISALQRHCPQAENIICLFHVLQALKSKIGRENISRPEKAAFERLCIQMVKSKEKDTFDNLVKEVLEMSTPGFAEYLQIGRLGCANLWALHLRKAMAHGGNNTDNKVESENHRLKRILNSNTPLGSAINTINNTSIIEFRAY